MYSMSQKCAPQDGKCTFLTQRYYLSNVCRNPEQRVQLHPRGYINTLFPRGVNEFQMKTLFHAITDSALVEGGRL